MLRDTTYISVSFGARLLSGVVVFVLLARALGPEPFGTFMYWLSAATLVAVIGDFGLGQRALRDVAAARQPGQTYEHLWTAKLVLTVASVAAGAGMLLFAPAASGHGLALPLVLLGYACAASASEFLAGVLRAADGARVESALAVASAMALLLAVLVAVRRDASLVAIAWIFLASRLLQVLGALAALRRAFPEANPLGGRFRSAPATLRGTGWYASDAALTNGVAQVDTLIVRHVLGEAAAGIYQAGLRLVHGVSFAAAVLANVFLPRLARAASGAAEFRRIAVRALIAFCLTGLLGATALGAGRDWIVEGLYGGGPFGPLGAVLPWLAAFLFLRFVAGGLGILLTALGAQKLRTISYAGAVTPLLFAPLALHALGVAGMPLVLAASMAILGLAYAFFLLRLGRGRAAGGS